MNGAVCPCAVCEERFAGCHAKCEVFLVWQKEQMEQRRQKYKMKNREDLLDDFKAESIAKQRRRRK